jgi:hypothetical protein
MRAKSISLLAAFFSCCLFTNSVLARSWMEVPAPVPPPGPSFGIAAVSDTDVWSVGYQNQSGTNMVLTQHWDGSVWSVVPAQLPPEPFSFFNGVIALNSRNVWAVGHTVDQDGVTALNLIEQWDGSSWQIIPSPNDGGGLRNNYLYAVSAFAANDIWAVGYSDTISGPHVFLPLALHWDGTAWMVVSTPTTSGGLLLAVKALASDDVWAVGEHQAQSGHNTTSTTYILHWDGTLWSIVPSPNQPVAVNALTGVAGVLANDVWAVGLAGPSFSDNGALALHWDGTAWTIVPTAATSGNDPLYAVVSVTSHNVCAVGMVDGAPLTERWDGTAWSIIPTPTVEPGAGLVAISVGRNKSVWASGYQSSDELFLELVR